MIDDINNDLVLKSINGDIISFESLIKKHYAMLHRYIACKVSNAYDQENVIQETLLLAWINIKSLKNPKAFKRWLISIATNCCNKWYKANSKASIPTAEETLSHIIDKRYASTNKPQYGLQHKIDKLPQANVRQ